ncbi:MAG: nodulation protein NfeD [Thermoanaerobaculia bacterium]|nr:nodulation protein NfeD [Thermoanaerobaculia bacterium]
MRDPRSQFRLIVSALPALLALTLFAGGSAAMAQTGPAGSEAAGGPATLPSPETPAAQSGPSDLPRPPITVVHLRLRSILQPVAQQFLVEALADADRNGAALLVVELDTPGGLLSSTREISTAMLGAATPVVVYVAPSGAQAASAGFFLLMAADFAAMAPGTNTGAAHPVGGQGETIEGVMGEKVEQDAAATIRALAGRHGRNVALAEEAVVESRSFTDQEALAQGLVDVVASDLAQLLLALEGRTWEKAGRKGTLALSGARISEVEMSPLQRMLAAIVHPNIAYLLMSIGFLGIYFELAHPGAVLPGVVGAIALVLGLYALSVLPVNLAGVGLILLALVFFIAEIKVTSYGLLAVGGIIALVLGSLLLFRDLDPALRLSRGLVATTALVAALLVGFLAVLAARAQRSPVFAGKGGLEGELGRAIEDLDPAGRVFVHGEIWNADAEAPVRAEQSVRVVGVDGLRLKVRPEERSS